MSDTYSADPYAQYLNGSAPAAAPPAGNITNNILKAEGTGQNPRSSAAGPGQFIDSTWTSMINKYRPDLSYGKTPEQIVSMKTDPQYAPVAKALTNAYAAENSENLSNAGFQPTPGNVYLSHFAGPQGATSVLKSDPNTPVSQVLGQKVVEANPFLANMTTGQLQQWVANKVGAGLPAEGYYGGRMHVNITGNQATPPQTNNNQADPYAIYVSGSQPSQNTVSGIGALYTGLKSGLSANFSDEMSGLASAGRTMLPDIINPDKPGSAVTEQQFPLVVDILLGAAGAGKLAYEGLTGGGDATKAYTKARDIERKNQQAASEQHPILNTVGNVAGALALPVGGMAEAVTLPGRIAAGGLLGAGYGAAYGAGEGTTLSDRATRAGTGALLGGVAGGVAPPIMAGVSAVGRGIGGAVGKVLGHPIQTIRAGLNTEQEAARRVGTSILADHATGRPGMSAADLAAAQSSGQPTAVIDIGGENTRALARSAANTSPSGRAALDATVGDRFSQQAQRVSEFVRSLVPTPGNATRTAEAIDAAERAANKGGYARAYASGNREITSSELTRLQDSPDVVAAMKDALAKGKSRAVADKLPPPNPSVKNIQFWDNVYRSLRDDASASYRAGKGDEGSYLSSLSKQMRTELDTIVPEYGKARGVASEFFQAENALEAGQKFVSMRGPIEEARIAHAKMTPAQKSLFAEGFVSDLSDKISKISDNRSVTIDRIFNSPDGRARAELALGKGRAQDLEYFLRRENMMDMARQAIKGNSTTVRQLVEAGIAGSVTGGAAEAALEGKFDAKTILAGALLGGAAAGHRAINFKVAQRVGEMLASNDPKVLLTAIKMAKTNPDAGKALRRAETMMEKLVGSRSSEATPLLPSVSPGRADDQQQQ